MTYEEEVKRIVYLQDKLEEYGWSNACQGELEGLERLWAGHEGAKKILEYCDFMGVSPVPKTMLSLLKKFVGIK